MTKFPCRTALIIGVGAGVLIRGNPDSTLDPDAIPQTYIGVLRQPRSAWSLELRGPATGRAILNVRKFSGADETRIATEPRLRPELAEHAAFTVSSFTARRACAHFPYFQSLERPAPRNIN
jgi:hypothetical protein